MQTLAAAAQRPHPPPPVPPRPSRQVVADALKQKSPSSSNASAPVRPPCPTRQAPAPPANQRPWRAEDQLKQQQQSGGRTIVYDSAHLVKALESHKENQRKAAAAKAEAERLNGREEQRRAGRIEDTSRRKDGLSCNNISSDSKNNNDGCHNGSNGNGNVINSSNKDVEEIAATTSRDEASSSSSNGSNERKNRKKIAAHSVTFEEEDKQKVADVVGTGREVDTRSDKCPSVASTKTIVENNNATVVVIEKTEPRCGDARRRSPGCSETSNDNSEEQDNIQRLDWLEAGVRLSATKITLPATDDSASSNGSPRLQQAKKRQLRQRRLEEDDEDAGKEKKRVGFADLGFSSIIERIAMSSLQGLPPLPRSLSGFNLNGAGLEPVVVVPPVPARSTPTGGSRGSQRLAKTPSSTTSLSSQGSRPSPQGGRQLTTLDTQLAILRREMFGLRQLDLSLLSQLWSLNESIQEFRLLLQEQEDRAPSPSPSSDEGDDTSYSDSSRQPPPPPRRPAPTTPLHHHYQQQQQQQYHHHHHHHRSSRSSLRSAQFPPSDDSPSSEEYGAV